VILSLVRNSGASDDVEKMGLASGGRANIGFLKVSAGYLLHVPQLKCNATSSLKTGLMVFSILKVA
jgi:hypothetical protein